LFLDEIENLIIPEGSQMIFRPSVGQKVRHLDF